ncbi:TPA: hypothetical protein L3666_000679 [Pseudomonas aeruginosa]|nr:hypothetical protein [Pseudomonas aeruginosa]
MWWNDNGVTQTGHECRHCGFFVADVTEASAEQAEAERPEGTADFLAIVREAVAGAYNEWKMTSEAVTEIMEAHERIVGALRFERQQMDRAFTACINERDAALAHAPTSSASPSCKWTESSGIWETGCGQTWSFIEDGPAENGALFCHHCGGRLVLIKSDDQEDDGEPCPECMEHGCNGECAGHGAMGD